MIWLRIHVLSVNHLLSESICTVKMKGAKNFQKFRFKPQESQTVDKADRAEARRRMILPLSHLPTPHIHFDNPLVTHPSMKLFQAEKQRQPMHRLSPSIIRQRWLEMA